MSRTHKLMLAALSVLFLASMGMNVVLFRAAKAFYTRMQAVRLDPLGVSEGHDSMIAKDGHGRLLIVGDSRAAQWKLSDNFCGYAIMNAGIGEQTTAQILGRLDDDLRRTQPDVVLIQAGVNDLKTIPLLPGQQDQIVANSKRNLEAIVRRCTEAGRRVIVSTVFPVGPPTLARRPVWSSSVAAGVRDLNVFLKSLATENVEVLDSYELLVGDDGLINVGFSKDTLHLNDSGYEAINRPLEELLEARTGSAQQVEATVPVKAAPSASSTVR